MTPRQQRFVQEYLVDLNATQAAIRAGYSARTANRMGSENLSKPVIAEAIAEGRLMLQRRTEVDQDRVLRELAKVAFASISDVISWGMRVLEQRRGPEGGEAAGGEIVAPFIDIIASADLPPEITAAVAEVALTKDGLRIKMHDKVGALEKIGRTLGMFKDRLDLTSGDKPLTLSDFYGSPRTRGDAAGRSAD